MGSRSILSLLGLAAAGLIAAGCGSGDSSATTQRIVFKSGTGTENERVLSVNGLTLLASCKNNAGQTLLAVAAETAVDNAVISSHFGQKVASGDYVFAMSDFDRSYGPWDFAGTNPAKTAGTLSYSRPDGGQVTVTYVADENTAQGPVSSAAPPSRPRRGLMSTKKPPSEGRLSHVKEPAATYSPRRGTPSTIGAEGLNCSVRNGKRCFPLAITTETARDPAPAGLENCTQAKIR